MDLILVPHMYGLLSPTRRDPWAQARCKPSVLLGVVQKQNPKQTDKMEAGKRSQWAEHMHCT